MSEHKSLVKFLKKEWLEWIEKINRLRTQFVHYSVKNTVPVNIEIRWNGTAEFNKPSNFNVIIDDGYLKPEQVEFYLKRLKRFVFIIILYIYYNCFKKSKRKYKVLSMLKLR